MSETPTWRLSSCRKPPAPRWMTRNYGSSTNSFSQTALASATLTVAAAISATQRANAPLIQTTLQNIEKIVFLRFGHSRDLTLFTMAEKKFSVLVVSHSNLINTDPQRNGAT